MADGTGIEWTHRAGTKGETWNPIVGCSIATAGCINCYALRAGLHPVTGRPFVPHLPLPRRWETGGMVGAVEIVDAVTSHSSDWFVGQRALVLRKGRTHPFIPVAGQLGFFDWRGRIIGGERAAPMASQGSLL